jgi:AraC family transcriptional regulator, regulatory protein of adaptative response / DNA-3-methyladenine glycosylase II
VLPDFNEVWPAIESRDPRFDGWVFRAVTTTGIYCRPCCAARTPRREHVRLFATAAAARSAGFRACRRCRPDASPGSPEWDRRSDLVARAMRLIVDGVVDRDGVQGLARRLGYSERHVHRELVDAVGAGPVALARSQRAETAQILLETTALPISEVAFAAGFQSVRQFNDMIKDVFGVAPRLLRGASRRAGRATAAPALNVRRGSAASAITLRLAYRVPFDADGLFEFLVPRSIPHIEEVLGGAYRRSLSLPHGAGVVELMPARAHVRASFDLDDVRDLTAAIHRARALFDLDSDPQSVVGALGPDPVIGPLIRAVPGRRMPGSVDPHELAVRAVLGQQVSLSGAATLAGRLVLEYGDRLERPVGAVSHAFPSAAAIAAADPARLPMPQSRGRALVGMCDALASGKLDLDAGADRAQARRQMLELPGIGPWTAEYVAMRALHDPDAFLPTDLGIKKALESLCQDARPAAAAALADRWRPYRSYAAQHLWGSLAAARRV